MSFAEGYVDVATRIAEVLRTQPVPRRGPKPTVLRESLTSKHPNECWPWAGRRGANGYGIAVMPGQRDRGTSAHRLVFALVYGDLPDDVVIDHICHNPETCSGGPACPHRACVNPLHLAAVSPRENVLRSNSWAAVNAGKRECLRGHAFTPENTYVDPAGRRACRTCQRAHWRRYAAANKEAQ